MRYLLALDQGTTSSRAIIFDHKAEVIAVAQREINVYTPQSGWVEQDAEQIWTSQITVAQQALASAGILAQDIATIGVTNQRETTIVWDKQTGKPIAPAIVWQDRRCRQWCEKWIKQGYQDWIAERTGLRIDPYFSAGKLAWLLENEPQCRVLAKQGRLAFGTVDSWLLWKLTHGEKHVIEISNASRTMLMNINHLQWDQDILDLFDIPKQVLPEIIQSNGHIADTADGLLGRRIPIHAILGDQQSALYGQGCFEAGMAKNTYGTGCFMLMNTGSQQQTSQHQLLSTVAWKDGLDPQYALEGSVFMAGAIVQWLRDGLGMIRQASEIEQLANQVDDADGVILVPAFTGLGAPYWDQDARALLCGLSRGTTSAHIARAALEAIAFQVADVLVAMQHDSATVIQQLRVDGGASNNNTLMQFQADILGVEVQRPKLVETTAWGAALMAGLSFGYFSGSDQQNELLQIDRSFEPCISQDQREFKLSQWHQAVNRTRSDLDQFGSI